MQLSLSNSNLKGKDLSSNWREIRIIESLSNSNPKGGGIKVRIRETVELRKNEFFFSFCLVFHTNFGKKQ